VTRTEVHEPVIGRDLYERLAALSEAARVHATAARNFHAAALFVVLEALRVQAENKGTRVAVYISPEAS
jgi:hypothetical protein